MVKNETKLWPQNDDELAMCEFWRDQGLMHAKSSKETIKMYKSMNEDLKEVKKTQDEHSIMLARQDENISYIKEAIEKIDNFIGDADDKYAAKSYVDKVFGTSLVALLGFFGWIIKTFITYLMGK